MIASTCLTVIHYSNLVCFCFGQDTTSNVHNRTLIIDNANQELAPSQAEIAGWDTTSYREDGGRTWITDDTTGELDEIHILGMAHVALSPQLPRYIQHVGVIADAAPALTITRS